MPERHRPNPSEQENDSGQQNRRWFLKAAGFAMAGLAGKKLLSRGEAAEPPIAAAVPRPTAEPIKLVDTRPVPELGPAGQVYEIPPALIGRNFSGLYSDYTGIRGIVPQQSQIDFNYQLRQMWEKKLTAAGENPNVASLGNTLLLEYTNADKQTMDLADYQGLADGAVDEVKNNLDFDAVGKLKHLNEKQALLLKQICASIEGRDLLAFALTELMPSEQGELNTEVLEFLLNNAGRRYVESIPSLGDQRVSFGPYQFTQDVFSKDEHGKNVGVLKTNDLLPKGVRVPERVEDLRGADHHKAAYLFMVENLAHLLKELKGRQLEAFSRAAKDKSSIITYAAAAHHRPVQSRASAAAWLEHKIAKPFLDFCGGELYTYAKKTGKNFKALMER